MDFIQHTHDQLIMEHDQHVSLYKIGLSNLSQFSKFVFQQYAYHYSKKYQWEPSSDEQVEMENRDQMHYGSATYFGFKNQRNELLGTIKITRKEHGFTFPFEHDFDLKLEEVMAAKNIEANHVWHLGRFAIHSKKMREEGLTTPPRELLRLLLIHAFRVMNSQQKNIIIAESDVLIYHLFHELGINMQTAGDAKHFVGSPTYPVILTGTDIQYWLETNLIHEEVLAI